MNHSGNDRCPFLLQWDTNHMSQDLLMLMSLLISTLSCSFPVIVERERERPRERYKKKSFRLWIDSLRSIRNYQPLQLRFLLHLNKLSDKCRAQISTVEIVICIIIGAIVNALKLKNPCMCTILNANFSKLSFIKSLGEKSNFDKLY